ncbi:MAG: glycoside hydrolase family 125 protein [Oscillospiraceae bacterium]
MDYNWSKILEAEIRPVKEELEKRGRAKLAEMFDRCYRSTLETTVELCGDGTTFVITGDIPAMWLRDSSAQVRHYIPAARRHPEVAAMIEGVIRRQMAYIVADPYANAFNREANGKGHAGDRTEKTPLVWERKYEIDSLCYPLHLAYDYWKEMGSTAWLDGNFALAAKAIVSLWRTEQRHEESPYYFERVDCVPTDTLPREGRGTPVAYTGMTWSGFRPSDDACTYGYLVPANLFAAKALQELAELAETLLNDSELAVNALALRREILDGVNRHGTLEHPEFGQIYAYEVDGLGNYNLMDDANVPSLLSLPYLGCSGKDNPVYQNTRAFVLSSANLYYYEGKVAKGIGSPHTPDQYIWHIALSMQGLTADNDEEREELLDMLENTDAGTFQMHEGFHCDDPSQYTRPWFAWANSLFSEFVIEYLHLED